MNSPEKPFKEDPIHLEKTPPDSLNREFDPVAEKKLLRKIDLHLIPILSLLLLCAFVDRINVGNTRIQGLVRDLNMTENDYNIALFTFFITYVLFEVPFIVRACGVITIGQGVTHSFGGLVACRLLIGLFEAGFVPGCIYLISIFYKRHELRRRINLVCAASILAGSFLGLLAYGIAHMAGIANYGSWRWIFVLEGAATVLIAIFAYFYTPDWPQTAKFLTKEERELLLARLTVDTPDATMNHWNKGTAKRIFSDVNIWLGALMYLGIVKSIPIYLTAAVVTLTAAIFSDRLRHHFGFILLGCGLTTIGYGVLLASPYVPPNNNLGGHYKRGVGAGIQLSIGNCSVASNIFVPEQAPRYLLGYGIGLGFVWLCVFAACAFDFWIRRENQLCEDGNRDHSLNLSEEELNNLGDDHRSFRFTR
ncbi:major facilitator superfamily protein [Dactylonectria estremocensis]|uniref:Major facilitator superfamily protein n=1 Tax=Dactylonectria estremocensis TaxID=1079267 RepID=A0A9P9ERT2_9HYPO|nr:major facilitator superfamily protein [Dactylonectria estremocensis]